MDERHYILRASSVEELLSRQREIPDISNYAFKRYFLTDAEAECKLLPDEPGAVSYIQQPPLDGGTVAVWVYVTSGAEVIREGRDTLVNAGDFQLHFTAGMVAPGPDSSVQTRRILEDYSALLSSKSLTLADNCLRTWFFCRDIDDRYAGLVEARREFFDSVGLTRETHYLASTGIAGLSPTPGALVQMDALAVSGCFSQTYLHGSTHLNPTWEYGVTFERGVKASFGGRAHTLISGTASIDNKGSVLHVGDIVSQTRRMIENVEVLLREAGTGWGSVQQILVYLRNASDYEAVAPIFERELPGIPRLILLAPVCRPDWLIEMECMALDPTLPARGQRPQ